MAWVRVVDDDGSSVQCEVDIAKIGRRVKARILKFKVLRQLSDKSSDDTRGLVPKTRHMAFLA